MCSRYFCVAAGMERFSILGSKASRYKLVTCVRSVYQVVAEFSTFVLWPLTIWLMVILWVIMLWFHSWGIDAILGYGYGI